MKKCCVVAYAVKQNPGESDQEYQTRLLALEYIKYGKAVLLPDAFDYNATFERLIAEFIVEEPTFRAVEYELKVVDA